MTSYKFSKKSLQNLNECHEDLVTLFTEVIKYIDCTIIDGARSKEEQDEAFSKGYSKLKWPKSKHNVYGNRKKAMAADVAPFLNKKISYDSKHLYYLGGFVLAMAQKLKEEGKMSHKIRWGGDWNSNNNLDDQTFNDLVHFELL